MLQAGQLVNDFSQLLFSRTQYGDLTAVPSTFDEFVAALLTGRSNNPALSQVVGGASVVSTPESAFVYGDRELSASAVVSVGYAHSSCSTFRGSFQGIRTQHVKQGEGGPEISTNHVLPKTTSGTGSLSWSYLLTPRTTTSVDVSTTRTISGIQDAYSSQATFSVGRTISRRVFIQGMLGAGLIRPVRQTFAPTQTIQSVFGGSIGYKTYAHTLLCSFTRAVSDIYGLGADSTDSSSAAWTWKRPGRSISIGSGFGYSFLRGSAFPNARSWSANAGLTKALGSHMALSVSYTHTRFPPSVFLEVPNISQSGVVATFSWSPEVRQ